METLDTQAKHDLVAAARAAADAAYAPYSDFHVGAAVLDADGKLYTGCNVENASYGLTCCAERVALFRAKAEAAAPIAALAVISPDNEDPIAPCGACRQVMAELAPDALLLLAAADGEFVERTVDELLPGAFRLPG